MNNEQGMLHYTLLFIIFIYHPEWGEDSAKDVYIGSADFPGWYDGKSAYPYQAY